MGNCCKLMFFIVLTALSSSTQVPEGRALWRGLHHGSYEVGVRSVWTWDNARSFLPAKDWQGNVLHHPTARPIRLTIWYPAIHQKEAHPMPYDGYFHADDEPRDLHELMQAIEAYDRRSNANMFGGDAILLQNLLQTPTAAYRDERPAAGRFPVVVYSMGQNDYNQENVVLCEFLASYGYIVTTVPDLGPLEGRPSLLVNDPASYEAQLRDLQFALAEALRMPSADQNRVAAIGYSMGGIYTLLLAMRDNRVGAIIGLDASYMDTLPGYYFKFEESWYFDPSHIHAPLLSLYRKDDSPNPNMALVNQLRYSDRYLVAVPRIIHTDFNSYPLMTAETPAAKLDEYARQHRDQQTAVNGHIFVVETVLNFVQGALGSNVSPYLNLDQRCREFSLNGALADCKQLTGIKAPNEADFAGIAVKDGADAAMRLYDEAKARYPQETIIREKVLNRIGFESVYLGQPANAVKILQLNLHAYPESSDAYENLAEAYEAAGQKALALEDYKKALTFNPANKDAIDGVKKLALQKP